MESSRTERVHKHNWIVRLSHPLSDEWYDYRLDFDRPVTKELILENFSRINNDEGVDILDIF